MKWGFKETMVLGKTRTLRRFAWFPTLIEVNKGSHWIWLESYTVAQSCYQGYRDEYGRGAYLYWESIKYYQD